MEYAYVGVSSKEQNEERRIMEMRELNIPSERIFCDKDGRTHTCEIDKCLEK